MMELAGAVDHEEPNYEEEFMESFDKGLFSSSS